MTNKIAFAKSKFLDITDYTKKVEFIKLVDPAPGDHSKRNLFKNALVLMYDGIDYAGQFLS